MGSAVSLTRLVWKHNFRSEKIPVSSYSSPRLWSPLADVPNPELWSCSCQHNSGLRSDQRAGTIPSSRKHTAARLARGSGTLPGPSLLLLPPSLCALCRRDGSQPGRGPLPCPWELGSCGPLRCLCPSWRGACAEGSLRSVCVLSPRHLWLCTHDEHVFTQRA